AVERQGEGPGGVGGRDGAACRGDSDWGLPASTPGSRNRSAKGVAVRIESSAAAGKRFSDRLGLTGRWDDLLFSRGCPAPSAVWLGTVEESWPFLCGILNLESFPVPAAGPPSVRSGWA